MGGRHDDFELLLTAPDVTEVLLAENLLAEAGIPILVESAMFDMIELGRPEQEKLHQPDVFVPRGALEKARAVLDEAWGTAWRARDAGRRVRT